MWQSIRHIVESEGPKALWKGNLCTVVHRFPFCGLSFLVVEGCKRRLPHNVQRHWWGKLLPGAVAACAATLICYPLEVVRTRRMAEAPDRRTPQLNFRDVLAHVRQDLAAKRWCNIYRGVDLALAVTVPSLAVSFGIYASIKDWARARGIAESSFLVSFLAGGTSGVIGSTVTFPLDVLRRRCQVMGMHDSVPTRGWRQEFWHILRSEGTPGFWRGIVPELAKVFPTVAVTFMAYEQIRCLLPAARSQQA